MNFAGAFAVKLDLPYLFAPRAKGRQYFYYRRNGHRLPILDEQGNKIRPGHPDFITAYNKIHDAFEGETAATEAGPGTLAHLVAAFKGSPEWTQLAKKTQSDYRRYLDDLGAEHGDLNITAWDDELVLEYRDRFADTPRTANYRVAVLRRLFGYAAKRKRKFLLPPAWSNPASAVDKLKTGEGHLPWEEEQIAAFRKRWKPDTVERIAFELLLNTGQRGGDVAPMVRTHYRHGVISVKQEKTNERVDVPASRELRAVLDPWLKDHNHVSILTTPAGRSFKVDFFRHLMRDAYRAAELPTTCTTHGLRYTAATILSELGCDWETIGSITGHRTAEMVRKYTAKKRRARVAIRRLDEARAKRKRNAAKPKV